MNRFDYANTLPKLMTPEIMNLVSAIHEYRGRQPLYLAMKPDIMDCLTEIALVQSTGASNRIENIHTSSDARLHSLLAHKVEPRNRSEHEIVGYRYVLDLIHDRYADIPVNPGVILQFHRDLYRGVDVSFGGHWKDADNIIAERSADGRMVERFRPTNAVATPGAIESLCDQYRWACKENMYNPLLISSLFIFDFVSIHPFNDGNGRMSRLLTLLLLYKANYMVGKYISIEGEIEKTKSSYYEALRESSFGWDTGECDYVPFTQYLLGVVLACYKELDERVGLVAGKRPGSYEDRVHELFSKLVGSISKRELMEAIPGISRATVERILQSMQKKGEIEKVGAARSTRYRVVE